MVKNELLKMKKIKKDKKKTILTEIVEPANETPENGPKIPEDVLVTSSKDLKKRKKSLNGIDEVPAVEATGPKQKKGDNEEPKITSIKGSNIRCIKKRLEADYDYVTNLLALVHIPQHKRDTEEMEDEVEDVPEEVKEKMRKESVEGRAANPDELRERLQKKLEQLRGSNPVGAEAKKQKKLKKQLAKIEKKKAMKDELKMKHKLMKLGNNAGNKVKLENLESAGGKPVKPVKTSSGKVVFSKFDFTTEEGGPGDEKKRELDPKAALKQIQKKKEKLKNLQEKGKDGKVKIIENENAWKTAMDRAEGVTVKDDVALLKKSIKKIEQRKKSSKNKWEGRVDETSKKLEAKQKKRTENLQKRKTEKKQKKQKSR